MSGGFLLGLRQVRVEFGGIFNLPGLFAYLIFLLLGIFLLKLR